MQHSPSADAAASPAGISTPPSLGGRTPAPLVSIVIPMFNEVESVDALCQQLHDALAAAEWTWEVVFVNDGSRDQTAAKLAEHVARHPHLFGLVDLQRNFGQTAALMAGIDYARGEIIVPMDGDLQNDPKDIPRLVAKIGEGFDVVSGWRRNRQDASFRRVLPSRIANKLISTISGVRLHDYGCSLKAYRRDVLSGFRLYGEMHRFVPIFARWQGATSPRWWSTTTPAGSAGRNTALNGSSRSFSISSSSNS